MSVVEVAWITMLIFCSLGMYLVIGGAISALYVVLSGPPYDTFSTKMITITVMAWPIATAYTIFSLIIDSFKVLIKFVRERNTGYVFPEAKVRKCAK